MWKWPWTRTSDRSGRIEPSDDARLALEQELQGLRLELEERGKAVSELRRQVERLKLAEADRLVQALRTQMERLLAASATPITQLNTQAHLMDALGRPVAAGDVMANVRGVLRVFEDEGMSLVGELGEPAAFDPAVHEPLQASAGIRPGEPVEIRLSGVAYQGRSLRKAGVIRREP